MAGSRHVARGAMTEQLDLEIIHPEALRPEDRAAWEAIRADDPTLDHPYLDPRFALAAAEVPGAALAVFRRRGGAVAFFPFQRRGRLIQPLGAPLSDYHGVVAAPADRLTPAAVARRLGGTLRVGGWIVSDVGEPGFLRRARMTTDTAAGPQAVTDWLDSRNHRFAKNLRRMARGLERDHGAATFVWDDRDPAVLEWIIERKRAQYRRTRRHDVFACGWTADLLRRLYAARPGGYGLRVASLRSAAGELVAAEASLDDGRTLHLWFPAYDPAYAAYGPGALLTRRELEQAAADGYRLVDFGVGDAGYKSAMAEAGAPAYEGQAGRTGPVALAARAFARGPAPLRAFQQSLGRRFDIINACETRAADWWAGAAAAAAAAARKTLGAPA